MTEEAKKPEQKLQVVGKAPEARELTDEEFRFRENDPYVQTLTLAMGNAMALSPAPETLYAAEVGVYRGRSLAILLEASSRFKVPINWLGFETFEGLPPLTQKDLEMAPPQAPYLKRPMFNDTTPREVLAYLEPLGCNDRLELVVGELGEGLKAQPKRKYFFVNIAAKTYGAHMEALEYFYPRLSVGAVMLFDDFFNRGLFPMAEAAVRDFMADKKEPIYWLFCGETHSNFRRAFVVKS